MKSKEPGLNLGLLKEKENRILEYKNRLEILTKELTKKEDTIKDLIDENLSLKKKIED